MKELKCKFGDQSITVQPGSKVDKKSLYGHARRVVEKDGKPLARGVLCPDGKLLRRDEITTADVDPEGTPVEEIVTEADGKPVTPQPSSFDQESALIPVPLKALIAFNDGEGVLIYFEQEVMRREVYTKAEAVRKLVVLRQSGEQAVPWLVYWTDYSAKRKDPLRVETAFAFTETRARALAEKFLVEKVTKGFLKLGAEPPPAAAAASSEGDGPAAKKPRAGKKSA